MSPPASLTFDELIRMVRILADVEASMPRKLRGVLNKEYGVNVRVNKFLGNLEYTAGCRNVLPDFRFALKANGKILVRAYNPGDWEAALKRAYDDLVTQSGAFAGLSIKLPEPASDIGKEVRPSGDTQPQKNKGLFGRLLGWFFVSED